jgi:tetraacyldisaccharide 4'-kinase
VIESPMRRVVAFCGIARPEQFFAALRSAKLDLAETIVFRDHHRYEQTDIDRLLQIKARTAADGFVTTEKDMVKLEQFSVALQPFSAAILKMELDSSGEAMEQLLRTLEQRTACRF